MPDAGLARPLSRPRGGVSRVELIPAPEWAGAVSPNAAAWIFCEDRARYLTQTLDDGLTRHRLEMTFPSTAQTRAAVERLVGTASGVVAAVTLASGESVVVGRSPRFGAAYPLRVTATSVDSGLTPADMPSVTVVLECVC